MFQRRSPRNSPRTGPLARTVPTIESKVDAGLSESKSGVAPSNYSRTTTLNPVSRHLDESKTTHNDPPPVRMSRPNISESKSEPISESKSEKIPIRESSLRITSESKQTSPKPYKPIDQKPIIEGKVSEKPKEEIRMNNRENPFSESKRDIIIKHEISKPKEEIKEEPKPTIRNESKSGESKNISNSKSDIYENMLNKAPDTKNVTFSPSTKKSSPPHSPIASSSAATTKTESKISEGKDSTPVKKIPKLGNLEIRFGLTLCHKCALVYENNIEPKKDRITLEILEKCFDEFNIKMNKDTMEIFIHYRGDKIFELSEFCSLYIYIYI